MLTAKPISTISYNTEPYLSDKLDSLTKAGKIVSWAFIRHKGEYDDFTEETEKDHFHVYIEPSRRLDTEELREVFKEFDPLNPTKPLGVMPFQSSKLDDWIMYGIHDKEYLEQKGEIKQYSYSWKEIRSWDDEWLKRAVKHAHTISLATVRKRERILEKGIAQAWAMGIANNSDIIASAVAMRSGSPHGIAPESAFRNRLGKRDKYNESKMLNERNGVVGDNIPFETDYD